MIRAKKPVSEPQSPDFTPVRVDLVDLDSPLVSIPAAGAETGIRYGSSLSLVRLHGRPLGLLELELPDGGLCAAELADRIALRLGDRVAEHLRRDGLPPAPVTASGLSPGPEPPPCLAAREQLLRDAPTASVVIITRGRPARVRRTVASILAGSYPHDRYEVIVVDTPSGGVRPLDLAGDPELAGKAPIRVVEELRPGISRGRNTGLEQAGGEFVVFADDDVDVDHHWLATSINAFGYGGDVGATSGMTLPGALLTPAQRWFEGFGGLQRRFDSRVYDLRRPPADEPLFPFTVGALGSGRSMAFRRTLLSELGGFDLALGPDNTARAGEDIEALARVLLSGRQVVHEPAAIVWHEHPSTFAALRLRMWGYGVGLTACLTRCLVDHPELIPLLARKLRRGLAFALSPRSEKNRKRQRDYPPDLIRLELEGMAYGPLAYAVSRWQQRRRPGSVNGRIR